MHDSKKPQPRRQAIDNFIPLGAPLSPEFRRQQQAFPQVGTTLSTYRGSVSPPSGRLDALPLPADQPQQRRRTKDRSKKHWSKKKITLLCLLPLILIGLWLGSKFVFNVSKIFHGNILGVFSTTKLRGEDQGRVNILLAGNSADDPGHDGANLTDSIMLISLDTRNHTGFMLSIPRDLYVNIPGYGHAKINETYVAGQQQHFSQPGYPDGGMGLLEEVVNQSLGIKPQYYALINYSALRDAVNAVGGVTVNIQSSDPRGLYDGNIDWTTHGPLVKLSNGQHTLTGQQALDLARARGDPPARSYGFANSDFTRTQDQRMLLLALKNKIMSTGVLANPVKLTNLFDSLGQNITTDMSVSEAHRAYDLMKQINNSSITSYGLNDINGTSNLSSYRTAGGESALAPTAGLDDFSQIQQALQRIMSANPIVRENARVVVLNGTNVSGLAGKNQSLLLSKNVNVLTTGDAKTNTATSFIIDNSTGSKPATLRLLKQMYGQQVTTLNQYAQIYQADFIVVLGSDKTTTPAH